MLITMAALLQLIGAARAGRAGDGRVRRGRVPTRRAAGPPARGITRAADGRAAGDAAVSAQRSRRREHLVRGRLVEEGIEDMQNLATANLVDVILHTRVPVGRLVDWLDQAYLALHLPPRQEPHDDAAHDDDGLTRTCARSARDPHRVGPDQGVAGVLAHRRERRGARAGRAPEPRTPGSGPRTLRAARAHPRRGRPPRADLELAGAWGPGARGAPPAGPAHAPPDGAQTMRSTR